MATAVYFVNEYYKYDRTFIDGSASHPKVNKFKNQFYIRLNRSYIEEHLAHSYLCLMIIGENGISKASMTTTSNEELVVSINNKELTKEAMLYMQELFGDTEKAIPQVGRFKYRLLYSLIGSQDENINDNVKNLVTTLVQYIGISPYHLWLYYHLPTNKYHYIMYTRQVRQKSSDESKRRNYSDSDTDSDKDSSDSDSSTIYKNDYRTEYVWEEKTKMDKNKKVVNNDFLFDITKMLEPEFVAYITDTAVQFKDIGIVTLWISNYSTINLNYLLISESGRNKMLVYLHIHRLQCLEFAAEGRKVHSHMLERLKRTQIDIYHNLIQCETTQVQNLYQFLLLLIDQEKEGVNISLKIIFIYLLSHIIQYFDVSQLDRFKELAVACKMGNEEIIPMLQTLWIKCNVQCKWESAQYIETWVNSVSEFEFKSISEYKSKKEQTGEMSDSDSSDQEEKSKKTRKRKLDFDVYYADKKIRLYDSEHDFSFTRSIPTFDRKNHSNLSILSNLPKGIIVEMLYTWIWVAIHENNLPSIDMFMTRFPKFDFIRNASFFMRALHKNEYPMNLELDTWQCFFRDAMRKKYTHHVPIQIWKYHDNHLAKLYANELIQYAYLNHDCELMSLMIPYVNDPLQTCIEFITQVPEIVCDYKHYTLMNIHTLIPLFMKYSAHKDVIQKGLNDPTLLTTLMLHMGNKKCNTYYVSVLQFLMTDGKFAYSAIEEQFIQRQLPMPIEFSLLYK